MKKILLLAVMFLSATVYSQNTVEKTLNAVSNIVDSLQKDVKDGVAFVDTSSLYKTIYNDVKTGLTGLASGLKVGVEHVYAVLVKQQVVKSIAELVAWFLIPLLLTVLAIYIAFKFKWFSENVLDNTEGFSAFGGVVLIAIPLLICVLGPSWQTIITGFVNPEYGAIQDIMNFIKK